MNAKKFFYAFGKALYHIDSVYDDFAKKSEVAPTLLWILYALNDGQPHTQREISEDWELPKSTVNTIVSQLRQQGYVELTPIKGKRREMTLELTDSGKEYADKVLADIYKKEAEAFKLLKDSEKDIIAVLEKLSALLREQFGGKR